MNVFGTAELDLDPSRIRGALSLSPTYGLINPYFVGL